ncbi:MAG: hypothetical protein LBM93_01645, partial [Oscillospiraceae bacterium]|nr:hypothetical protein [Oscillospiraceae bacterium]
MEKGLTREELSAKGFKPCPRCGAFYDPNDPNAKVWNCSLCGTDLSLSPEEVRASLLDDDELSNQLKKLNSKSRRLKGFMIGSAISCIVFLNFLTWILSIVSIILAVIFGFKYAKASTAAKKMLVDNITRGVISEVFDEAVYAESSRLPDETLKEADVLWEWNRAEGSDLISGKYKNRVITFCDIKLQKIHTTKDDDSFSNDYYPVFVGQWIICELGREVSAKLRLCENPEYTGKVVKKIFDERKEDKSNVETVNREFNRRFQ